MMKVVIPILVLLCITQHVLAVQFFLRQGEELCLRYNKNNQPISNRNEQRLQSVINDIIVVGLFVNSEDVLREELLVGDFSSKWNEHTSFIEHICCCYCFMSVHLCLSLSLVMSYHFCHQAYGGQRSASCSDLTNDGCAMVMVCGMWYVVW
jgi:hypothetical protein